MKNFFSLRVFRSPYGGHSTCRWSSVDAGTSGTYGRLSDILSNLL